MTKRKSKPKLSFCYFASLILTIIIGAAGVPISILVTGFVPLPVFLHSSFGLVLFLLCLFLYILVVALVGVGGVANSFYQRYQRSLREAFEATNYDEELRALYSEELQKRYTKLEESLITKQWKQADIETYHLMGTILGWNEYLLHSHDRHRKQQLLKNFPCNDLLLIDRLWIEHSEGFYGFSVQKKIYLECGGELDFNRPSEQTFSDFSVRVGWLYSYSRAGVHLELGGIDKSGHLPYIVFLANSGCVSRDLVATLLSHVQQCEDLRE